MPEPFSLPTGGAADKTKSQPSSIKTFHKVSLFESVGGRQAHTGGGRRRSPSHRARKSKTTRKRRSTKRHRISKRKSIRKRRQKGGKVKEVTSLQDKLGLKWQNETPNFSKQHFIKWH